MDVNKSVRNTSREQLVNAGSNLITGGVFQDLERSKVLLAARDPVGDASRSVGSANGVLGPPQSDSKRGMPEGDFDSADSIIRTAHVHPDLRTIGLRIGAQIVDPGVRPR